MKRDLFFNKNKVLSINYVDKTLFFISVTSSIISAFVTLARVIKELLNPMDCLWIAPSASNSSFGL
jgi:hypothetical protein